MFPYLELLVGTETKPALLMMLAACGLLLLIACTNLANLLLARNLRRRGEFATRATLGATLGQLLKQLIVESAVLVTLGTAGGIALALVVLEVLRAATAFHLPRLAHASMRPSVLAFTIAVSAPVTFFLTLLPAWRILRPGLLQDIHAASFFWTQLAPGRTFAGSCATYADRGAGCLRGMDDRRRVSAVAPAAGLLARSPGDDPGMFNSGQRGEDRCQESELKLAQIAESLCQLPGVVSAAFTDHPPLGHAINRYDFCSDAHPDQCKQPVNINPNSYAISPGYFATIGQPLVEGRDFNPADDGRNHVAIVNQALAAREWPGQSPLGHRVHSGEIDTGEGEGWATVVGVIGNVHNYDLVSAPGPDIYIPRAEDPGRSAKIILKVNGDPASLKHAARAKLKSQFPEATVSGFETMSEEMSNEVSARVFLMQVAMSFGAVALFLSILGTYGLLAYEVSLREKEIGIRLALGSSRERIIRLLLGEEGRWLVAGVMLGLFCAAVTGYVLRARFYGVHSTSVLVLVGSALFLLAPALLAIALPARRAAFQDPAQTLRRE